MIPKDKALELLDKFRISKAITESYAKQCALIAVDEIIKETMLHDLTPYEHSRTGYWLEVKQEIENL